MFPVVRLAQAGPHMWRAVDHIGWVEAGEPERLRDAAQVCTILLPAETQHHRRSSGYELRSGVVGFRREVGSESLRVLHPDFLVLRPQPNLRDQPVLHTWGPEQGNRTARVVL
jgi:hypothetical protein